jgi:hypothetical protein
MPSASRPTKSRLNALRLRLTVLEMELRDPYTASLGAAAIRSVTECLEAARRELAEAAGVPS